MPTAIARIETFIVPPRWLFVRVECADGLVGWGEASLEGHAEAVDGAFASLRDRFVGHDPARIEDVWQVAYRLGFYRGGPVLMSALSGLDQALWDLKGTALSVPVWQLLGGRVRDTVPVYAWIGGDRPEEVVQAGRERQMQGFRAVKMNATADLGWLDSPSALDETVARVGAVRDLGLDVGLDFHGRVHRPMAKQLAAAVEPLRPLFIEEPLLSEHLEGIAEFARHTTVRSHWASGSTAGGTSSGCSRRIASTSFNPTLATRAAFPNAGGSPPRPKPMTSRSHPIARSGH